MKAFVTEIRSAIFSTLILAFACGGVYPLVVFGLAQTLFRDKANGSLIFSKDGTVQGSRLIGQNFTANKYFHSRPSAAGIGYDAGNSSGSNLGPTSQKLSDAIRDRVESFRRENGLKPVDSVPADAVTASASGLDPHISPRNAQLQTARVAKTRNLSEDTVRELVAQKTDWPDLGLLGDAGVNVLELNLALDAITGNP